MWCIWDARSGSYFCANSKLMFRYSLSIRDKLLVIILSISIVTLLIGFSIVIWYDLRSFREEMVQRTWTLAEVVGGYTVSELVFDDKDTAEETLAKLQQIPEIDAAVLYDGEQQVFASFMRNKMDRPELPVRSPGFRMQGGVLHVVDRVVVDDELFGTLYLCASTEFLNEKIARYLRAVLLLCAVLIGTTLVAAAGMQGVISKPILFLADRVRGVSSTGDFSARLVRRSDDEVGELYDAWNDMLEQVERRERKQREAEDALRFSEARFRSIIEQSSDVMYVLGTQNNFLYVNPKFEEMLEVPSEVATKEGFDALTLVAPSSRDLIREMRERTKRGEDVPSRYEFECITHTAKSYTFEVNRTPIQWDHQDAQLGILRDITRRLKAETQLREQQEQLQEHADRLEQNAAELERSNRELDQFAYVVSHDLRAPLRAISNLSSWIEDDLTGNVPEETAQHLELLRKRTGRLENLISGILEYSRVGRTHAEIGKVDVGQLISEVIEDLAPPEGISIKIAPNMPTLRTERIRLAQVFLNLIGNAVKHHPDSNGKIDVGFVRTKGQIEFTVSDDGDGIAPAYHERIFTIFQTLQPRDKYESTGVGLAIVKKIIDEVGGRIWIESKLGDGATFKFTWPLTAEEIDKV